MGRRVPWKIGMLMFHPVTSRPLIFVWKEAVLSPCNFGTTRLTAFLLDFYLLVTSRPMKWRTPPQCKPSWPVSSSSPQQTFFLLKHPSVCSPCQGYVDGFPLMEFLKLRWPDSRESIRRQAIRANHFMVPELNPFLANRLSGH